LKIGLGRLWMGTDWFSTYSPFLSWYQSLQLRALLMHRGL
jgi:hypothetical protein